jgi:hypothetical protein
MAYPLRHGVLLRRTLLRGNPLRADAGKQLSIDLEVVEDAGVVKRSGLLLNQYIVYDVEHTLHTLTIRLPGKVAP